MRRRRAWEPPAGAALTGTVAAHTNLELRLLLLALHDHEPALMAIVLAGLGRLGTFLVPGGLWAEVILKDPRIQDRLALYRRLNAVCYQYNRRAPPAVCRAWRCFAESIPRHIAGEFEQAAGAPRGRRNGVDLWTFGLGRPNNPAGCMLHLESAIALARRHRTWRSILSAFAQFESCADRFSGPQRRMGLWYARNGGHFHRRAVVPQRFAARAVPRNRAEKKAAAAAKQCEIVRNRVDRAEEKRRARFIGAAGAATAKKKPKKKKKK